MLNPPLEKLAAISTICSVAPTVVTLRTIQKIHYERRRDRKKFLQWTARREGRLESSLIRTVVCEADLRIVRAGTGNAPVA